MFSRKKVIIVGTSVIISIGVRYALIKYGINNPLVNYPFLFSFSSALTSLLSIPFRTTINNVIDIFAEMKLEKATINSASFDAPKVDISKVDVKDNIIHKTSYGGSASGTGNGSGAGYVSGAAARPGFSLTTATVNDNNNGSSFKVYIDVIDGWLDGPDKYYNTSKLLSKAKSSVIEARLDNNITSSTVKILHVKCNNK